MNCNKPNYFGFYEFYEFFDVFSVFKWDELYRPAMQYSRHWRRF